MKSYESFRVAENGNNRYTTSYELNVVAL